MRKGAQSNDAFAITAVYEGSKEEGLVMAWFNLDKVAHATTRARACESCHGSDGAQIVSVDYKWMEKPDGAYKDVLAGSYTIAADKNGLRIEKLAGQDAMPEGLKPLVGKWNLNGNFSVPMKNKKAYARESARYEKALKAGAPYHGE